MSELLDLVDTLTLPQPEKVAQKVGDTWVTNWVSHDPLLKQLGDAVWPSGEKNGGGGGLKSTRSPADLDALFEYVKMSAQIGDWCRMVGVRASRHPVEDLRAWYAASLAHNTDSDFYSRQLQRWVFLIRRHLHPPKSFTPTYPCPVCGKREWSTVNGDGGTFPLVVEYRLDDDDRVRGERAMCRACSTVWVGIESVTELADELRDAG